MNLVPSDLPTAQGLSALSRPGLDIILAATQARQAGLPTPRMIRDRETRDRRRASLNALCRLMSGAASDASVRPARFFDLSDQANALPETMNHLFTRGFQSMLNPLGLERVLPVHPVSPDVENME